MTPFWGQKTFCLITGASRGIGRRISIDFAKKVANGSLFLLIARSQPSLEETKSLVLSANSNCHVLTQSLDLEKPDKAKYLEAITSSLKTMGKEPKDFDHALIIHNAGSLGNMRKRVLEMEDVDELQNYFALNLTSMVVLNSQFFKVFDKRETKQRSIIQITSLAGIQPFKTWGFYCAGKATRDMFMKTLAQEEDDIQVLSYAPGPVDTEMYDKACNETGDEEVAAMMKTTRDMSKLLSPEETVGKLIKVLESKSYVKGEHVDYYDVKME